MERGVSTGARIEADPLTWSAGTSHRAMTERILELADEAGFRAALIDATDGTVTGWPAFARTVRAAAHGLSRRGLADGDTVGVFVQDAASFATAVNAVRAAGAIASPIRPDASPAEIAARLNACAARLLITSAPLAEVAAEAADRSRVRQVFAFGEAAGTTPFSSLLGTAKHGAAVNGAGEYAPAETRPWPSQAAARSFEEADLARADRPDSHAGLTHRDVVVAGPPCGEGPAYTALLDLTLLTGATLVAAPVALVTAAMKVYKGTAAIVPRGTSVPGISPDRVFTVP